jgi:hypothetical protein
MDVKKGYKLTEVGVIPDDWMVTALSELSWFQEGPGLRNWQFTGSGMKVINVTNLAGRTHTSCGNSQYFCQVGRVPASHATTHRDPFRVFQLLE